MYEQPKSETIAEMQEKVHEINVVNGWFDPEKPVRAFGDDIALLHSEVTEAYECFREGQMETFYVCKTHGRLTRVSITGAPKGTTVSVGGAHVYTDIQGLIRCSTCNSPAKPEGLGSELADVLVRLLDTCERYEIDIQKEFDIKVAYNLTRGYRHGGKVV